MRDVHFPTTDSRELIFRRYTQPEAGQKLLLGHPKLTLPEQPPPRLNAKQELEMSGRLFASPAGSPLAGRFSERGRRVACLLPLPARNEWGED
jgi:hypothetical protein